MPRAESLEDTVRRIVPCWQESIAPMLAAGERVLVVAHGNSLRALVKHLDGIGDDEIAALEIPTGIPLLYRLDTRLRPVSHEYLEHPITAVVSGAPSAGLTDAS